MTAEELLNEQSVVLQKKKKHANVSEVLRDIIYLNTWRPV